VEPKDSAQENQVQLLRSRIVELREMISMYAGTSSESFIREHIRQLQLRVQRLLDEQRTVGRIASPADSE